MPLERVCTPSPCAPGRCSVSVLCPALKAPACASPAGCDTWGLPGHGLLCHLPVLTRDLLMPPAGADGSNSSTSRAQEAHPSRLHVYERKMVTPHIQWARCSVQCVTGGSAKTLIDARNKAFVQESGPVRGRTRGGGGGQEPAREEGGVDRWDLKSHGASASSWAARQLGLRTRPPPVLPEQEQEQGGRCPGL